MGAERRDAYSCAERTPRGSNKDEAEVGGLRRNPLANAWTWDFQSPKDDDTHFCCLIQPVCGLIKATLPGLVPAWCLSVCLHSQVGGGQVLRHENVLEEEGDGQSWKPVEFERFATTRAIAVSHPTGAGRDEWE